MQSDRPYRIARGVVLVCVAVAAICFYELLSKGLGSPGKARLWFSLLIGVVVIGALAYIIVFYYRARLDRPSNDKIALESLAAAGQQMAREQRQRKATANNQQPPPPPAKG